MTFSVIRAVFAASLALCAAPASAWRMPYAKPVAKYPVATTALDSRLDTWWGCWKSRFLVDGLVKASDSGATPRYTSEGQAYGLLLSLWMNDTATFRTIHETTQSKFWIASRRYHGSRLDSAGTTLADSSFVGGAELDIAGALVSASALVDAGLWRDASTSYGAKAKTVLTTASGVLVNTTTKLVYSWPGSTVVNPSHQAVNWFQVFAEFADSQRISGLQWGAVRTASNRLLAAQPNSEKGMARNWSDASGGTAACGSACASLPNDYDMGFDAVRVPWRMGLAAMWHRDSFAIAWLRGTWSNSLVQPAKPGMYSLGTPSLWGWCDSAQVGCTPGYERTFTRAMWGAAATGGSDSSAQARSAAATIASHFAANASRDFLGDHDGTVRNDHLTQTMGLLGVLAMTGNAPDVWSDLKHVWVPNDTNTHVTQALAASPDTITVGGKTRLTVRASKPVAWMLRYKLHSGTTWTRISLNASARALLDTSIAIKGLAAGYKSGDTLDVQAFWSGSVDTSSIVLHVAISTSTRERPAKRLPGIARLDGSRLLLGAAIGGGAIEDVRFLDASGASVSSTSAHAIPGGLELQHVPTRRGLLFFEIRTATDRIQGRVLRF